MITHAESRASVADHPFALPANLSPALARVHAYWRGLCRGRANMPFADDLKLANLPDLTGQLMLIEVFERPLRYRIERVGESITSESLAGCFLEEVRPGPPLDFLASQCSATVEGAAPTYFHGAAGGPHARLLLPLWGEGQIRLLLGAFD